MISNFYDGILGRLKQRLLDVFFNNNKNESLGLILAFGFFIYLINFYFKNQQLEIVLFSINLTILIVILKYNTDKIKFDQILNYFLLKSIIFAFSLSILAMLLSYINFFKPAIDLPWQWDIYTLFLTLYGIKLPKLISGKYDEKLNIFFCIVITIIIGYQLNQIQKMGEGLKNLHINWDNVLIGIASSINDILITFLIFMLGLVFCYSLPLILDAKQITTTKELNYSIASGIYILIFSSVFFGNYVFYPILFMLILLDKTLFKLGLIDALMNAEDNFYMRSQYSKKIHHNLIFYSLILFFNFIAFRINMSNNSLFQFSQLLSIIALFIIIIYYIIIIFYGKNIRHLNLLILDYIGKGIFVCFCYFWYLNLNSFPLIEVLTNLHMTIGTGLKEHIFIELDEFVIDKLILGIKYSVKYFFLLEIAVFFPVIIADFCKFNFYIYNEIYEKRKLFKYFLFFSLIYVFAVIIPFIILGNLSISFGLESISIGKISMLVYILIISYVRMDEIFELYRQIDNFNFHAD